MPSTATIARAGLAGAAAAALVVPAVAQSAPAISAQRLCVTPGQQAGGQLVARPVVLSGVGFGPGANVEVRRGARLVDFTQAGADGVLRSDFSVFDLQTGAPRSTSVTVQASDVGGPGGNPPPQGFSQVLRIRVAPYAFSATPRRARPATKVRFKFSGFPADKVIYAHYRFNGRVRANVAMGRASNPCGLLNVRRPQIPLRNVQVGTWSIQFDNRARFSPKSRPRLRGSVSVFRTFR